MEHSKITPVTLNDVNLLRQISRQTFYETFAEGNSEADMQHYLNKSFSIEQLTTELTNENSSFYFATFNNQVIGYLKVNSGSAQTELQDDQALEIERFYVTKEFHGKNIGQLLYNQVIQIANQKKTSYVWLGVWEKNTRAIRFYKKNGFMEFGTHIFKLGNDAQTDILMKLDLSK
jgi:diamine N-acetyltransferase